MVFRAKLLCAVVTAGLALMTANACLARQTKPASTTAISGYKKWKQVNSRPYRMQDWLARLCRNLTPIEQNSPHADRYVVVFVNSKGGSAMLKQKAPTFPVGSVIVKEKRVLPGDKTPELMTVMVKQLAGSRPKQGDWDYFVVSGKSGKVEQSDTKACVKCHAERKATDYVFRESVSPEQRKRWR